MEGGYTKAAITFYMDAPIHIFWIVKFIDVSNLTFKRHIVNDRFLNGKSDNVHNLNIIL